jgi:hypothetical protein
VKVLLEEMENPRVNIGDGEERRRKSAMEFGDSED